MKKAIIIFILLLFGCASTQKSVRKGAGEPVRSEAHQGNTYLTNKDKAGNKHISVYSNNKLMRIISYYANGKILEDRPFINDKLSGTLKMFSTNGMITWEIDYKDGKMSGPSKHYYQTGELESISIYSNGFISKGIRAFDKKGNLANGIHKVTLADETGIEGNCINGVPNGVFKVFDKEGMLIIEAGYKDGKPNGKWKYFNPAGSVTNEKLYKEGILIE